MSEIKDGNDPACGGCGGACKENSGKPEKEQEYGSMIAEAAMADMQAEATRSAEEPSDEEVNGFVECCEKRGQNPFEVVAYIAKKNGIMLSEDSPKNEAKRKIYAFLKAVIKKLVMGFALQIADEYGFGVGSLANMAIGATRRCEAAPEPVKHNKTGICFIKVPAFWLFM